MPASNAQVFGPNTVDPDFTSTGEKTLLTMNTNLPSSGKNIILVSYAGYTSLAARGTFRIYKGSTLLYETRITNESFTYTRTRPFHHLLIAVDSSPTGNDSYSFRINITTAASSSATVHVQGMVIKVDTVVWGYNTTAVNIESGETGTVTSINTSFPSGSKVAVIATVYAGAATITGGNYLIGAGNIKLKSGSTVVSSNQFDIGSYRDIYPLRASLIYLDTPTSSSQTYSIEITNGSTLAHNCYAEIVAFDVTDAAFLDTDSVAVTTTQTTVGNLSTNLSGDVAVIALVAVERTASNDGDTFAANAVVLQRNNSSTDQVNNLLAWYIYRTSYNARSGVLPLFRYDTNVTNPSYQVKMTASGGAPNGEAKILAFVLPVSVIKKVFGETVQAVEEVNFVRGKFGVVSEVMRETEGMIFGRQRFRVAIESVSLSEFGRVIRSIARIFSDVVNIVESVIMAGIGQFLVKVISEVEQITEVFMSLRNRFRQFSENMRITETLSRIRAIFRFMSENISIFEVIARSKSVVKAVGESIRVLEVAVKARLISRIVGEIVRIVEFLVLERVRIVKTYIKRLVSVLKGTARGGKF